MKSFLIITIFVIFAFCMMSKKLPALLALPSMAILIAIVSGLPITEIFNDIIGQGSIRLYAAIITTIFGAILAQVINKTGISTAIIRVASEFCGDNPIVLAIVLTFATALIFTSVSGLGSVIMVGTIVLPILISIGIKPIVAAVLLIMGLNLGGLFNLSNFAFYKQLLDVNDSSIRTFALILSIVNSLIILLYIFLNVKKERQVFHCAVLGNNNSLKVRWFALITPIIPIVLLFTWPIVFKKSLNVISAILIGILYGIITTRPREIKNILCGSFLDGISDAAPAISLMIGIGILLQAVTNNEVSSILSPIILKIIPSYKITYVLIFLLLCPFALFRGPLNLYGLGSGIVALMLGANILNPLAILGAIMSIGAVQGICDPTNTHNVWVANYINNDATRILKKTLPYVLLQVLINLIVMSILFV